MRTCLFSNFNITMIFVCPSEKRDADLYLPVSPSVNQVSSTQYLKHLLLIDKYTLCKYVTQVDFDITNKDIDIYVFKKAGQMCIIIWLIVKYTDYCPT